MAKGFKAFAMLNAMLLSKQAKNISKLREYKDIEFAIKRQYEPEKVVIDRVNSNYLQKVVLALNAILKQLALQSGNQLSFYSALMQFLTGDVESDLDVFKILGVNNKNQIDLNQRLENLLSSGDGLTFIAKLFSSSFTTNDGELISKYSPLTLEELNKVGEWFAIRNTDGKLLSFSEIMLGLVNYFGNLKPK